MGRFPPRAVRFWPLMAITFLTDLATKALAEGHLPAPGTPYPLLGDLVRFTLTYNHGGALGIDTGRHGLTVLILISSALIIGLGIYYRTLPLTSTFSPAAVGLLLGGALGNLRDRVGPRQAVVDFIDIGIGTTRFWTFNVADSAIFIGAVLLAWWFWRGAERGSDAALDTPCPGPPQRSG